MSTEHRDVLITVHGTFAGNATWVEESSTLARSVLRRRRFRVSPFRWDGENSHAARRSAGEGLARKIVELHEASPATEIHAVGHSHGGNVILHALRDENAARIVNSITFMGTPFFKWRLLSFEKSISFFTLVLHYVISFSILLFALASITENRFTYRGEYTYLLMGGCLFLAFTGYQIFFMSFVCDKIYKFTLAVVLKSQARMINIISHPAPDVPVFVGIVRNDEAGIWLSFLIKISSIPWIIWQVLRSALIPILIGYSVIMIAIEGGIIFTGFSPGILNAMDDGSSHFLTIMFALIGVVCVLPIAAAIVSSLVRGNKFAFGWEGLLGASVAGISTTSKPTWSLTVDSREFSLIPKGVFPSLNHSQFYDDPTFLDEWGKWISKSESEKNITEQESMIVNNVVGRRVKWLPSNPNVLFFLMGLLGTLAIITIHLISLGQPKTLTDMEVDQFSKLKADTLLESKEYVVAGNSKLELTAHAKSPFGGRNCYLGGDAKFDDFDGSIKLMTEDWYWISKSKVDQSEDWRERMENGEEILQRDFWRTAYIDSVFSHYASNGKRVSFNAKIDNNRIGQNVIDIALFNSGRQSISVIFSLELRCLP